MTKLKPVAVYTLHPDQLENLGYDISQLNQEQFELIAQGLANALEYNDVDVMLDIVLDGANVPLA